MSLQKSLRSKAVAVPLRTCLVCRLRAEKKTLCRLVQVGDELFYDRRFRAPGRGYYICRKAKCLSRFLAGKRRLGRLSVGAEALDSESRAFLNSVCKI